MKYKFIDAKLYGYDLCKKGSKNEDKKMYFLI